MNFHPHLHSLLSDVAWDPDGKGFPLPSPHTRILTEWFRDRVLQMLMRERRLSPEFARKLRSWRHSGFQVYCGRPVPREDEEAPERLCASTLQPSFAGTRLYDEAEEGQIRCRTAKGLSRSMDALDWIALVTWHVPNPREQMVRDYGWYSNASRGKRRRQSLSVAVPGEPEGASQPDSAAEELALERRRNWARLLRKIDEVDPLTCPRCAGRMKIIGFVETREAIQKILQHLGRWEPSSRSPPPPLFPHKLEAFLASLTPRQAQRVRASTEALFGDDVPVFEG